VKRIRRRLHEIMDLAALVRDRDIAVELCVQTGMAESAPLCRAGGPAGRNRARAADSAEAFRGAGLFLALARASAPVRAS
jgi:hypothetical protein